MSGYVYIMSNPAHSFIKIGCTEKDPTARANELYDTNSPFKNIVEYWALVDDWMAVEKVVHAHLNVFRINNKREFFDIEIPDAVNAIRSVSEKMGGMKTDWSSKIVGGKIPTKREWERELNRQNEELSLVQRNQEAIHKDQKLRQQVYGEYREFTRQNLTRRIEERLSDRTPLFGILGGMLIFAPLIGALQMSRHVKIEEIQPFLLFIVVGIFSIGYEFYSKGKKRQSELDKIESHILSYDEYSQTASFRKECREKESKRPN